MSSDGRWWWFGGDFGDFLFSTLNTIDFNMMTANVKQNDKNRVRLKLAAKRRLNIGERATMVGK